MKALNKILALAVVTVVLCAVFLVWAGNCDAGNTDYYGRYGGYGHRSSWILGQAEWMAYLGFAFLIPFIVLGFIEGITDESPGGAEWVLFSIIYGFFVTGLFWFLVLGMSFLEGESPRIPPFLVAVVFFVSFFFILELNPEIFGNIIVDTFLVALINVMATICITAGVLAVVGGYRGVNLEAYVVVSLCISIPIRIIKWAQQA